LRRSDDYKKACAKNGKGMAKLYKDFGDVYSEKHYGYLDFWVWWTEIDTKEDFMLAGNFFSQSTL